MVNRILRDDPAKGLTALKEPATFRDIINTWKDSSMWGLYFVGLVAYIPAAPVQAYLSLTLKRIGFSRFDSNMLSIPSAVLQIVLMLALAFSSNHFMERTWHCIIGEFWCLPLLVALLTLPAGGHEWGRFTITTMISGCEYFSESHTDLQQLTRATDPYFHPIVSAWISENSFDVKKRAITAATYNVIVQVGSVISSRKLSLNPHTLLYHVLTCHPAELYRADDQPYYHRGNKILISICALSLVTFLSQREYLRWLNKRKARAWDAMSNEERVAYQADQLEREKDGNKRLDFRFQY